jgi:hypothetical protein
MTRGLSASLVERRANFLRELEEKGIIQKLFLLAREKNYAISMLIDMLQRDYSSTLDTHQLTRKQIYVILQKIGIKVDNKQYLKLPQEVKLQFRYPANYTSEQIRECIYKQSLRGAIMTHDHRRKQVHYNPKNHHEYWQSQGLSIDDANLRAELERKRKSPFSVEFTKYENLSLLDKKFIISQLSVNRGLKGLEAMNHCISTLEVMLTSKLFEFGIEFSVQKYVQCSRELLTRYPTANQVYVFDVLVTKQKLLIECNGTYWHADPRVYREHDTLKHPGRLISAGDIWRRDALKMKIANELGYRTLVLWELDTLEPEYIQKFIERHVNV